MSRTPGTGMNERELGQAFMEYVLADGPGEPEIMARLTAAKRERDSGRTWPEILSGQAEEGDGS